MQTEKQQNSDDFELLKKVMNYNSIDKFDIGNIKLSLMATHPFKYLRGTAKRFFDMFFESLKYTSFEFKDVFKDKNLLTACTNDTHVGNFGFTEYDSRFITNDFDEYLNKNPAKIHEKGIKLILSKKFDKNLSSLNYKEKSYIPKHILMLSKALMKLKFSSIQNMKMIRTFLDFLKV